MSSGTLPAFDPLRMSEFLWQSDLVRPNNGIKNPIRATYSFWATLLLPVKDEMGPATLLTVGCLCR